MSLRHAVNYPRFVMNEASIAPITGISLQICYLNPLQIKGAIHVPNGGYKTGRFDINMQTMGLESARNSEFPKRRNHSPDFKLRCRGVSC